MEGELSRAELCLIKVRFLHGVELSGQTGGVVSTRSDGQNEIRWSNDIRWLTRDQKVKKRSDG